MSYLCSRKSEEGGDLGKTLARYIMRTKKVLADNVNGGNVNKIVLNHCYGGFALSKKAVDFIFEKYGTDISNGNWLERHDCRLVDCVESLGEEASGFCADLRVVEIVGDRYRIREYDGYESVETPDTMDWIVI